NFIEASDALARNRRKSVPLLVERLDATGASANRLLFHPLGLCGTAQAVAFLKTRAAQETNYWQLLHIVHALGVAGPRGEAALNDRSATARDNLAVVIGQQREGMLHEIWLQEMNLESLPFPPIPRRLVLPSRL